jgi:hypothetical protein
MYAWLAVLVEIEKTRVFRGLTSDAGAGNDGRLLAHLISEIDAGVRDGFAGGDYCKLREAVKKIGVSRAEVLARIVTADFRAILKTQLGNVNRGEVGYAALSGAQAIPELDGIASQGGNHSQPGDRNAPHAPTPKE